MGVGFEEGFAAVVVAAVVLAAAAGVADEDAEDDGDPEEDGVAGPSVALAVERTGCAAGLAELPAQADAVSQSTPVPSSAAARRTKTTTDIDSSPSDAIAGENSEPPVPRRWSPLETRHAADLRRRVRIPDRSGRLPLPLPR